MTQFDQAQSSYSSLTESGGLLPLPASEEPVFEPKVVNVSAVKHRSPFRYPGGKTWLVPVIRRWLKSYENPVKHFVEPFAGGAIVGLSALFDSLTENLTLVEKDLDVGAVWQTIVNGSAPDLGTLIAEFGCTEENVKKILNEPSLPDDILARAFVTIVRNRVQRGGIIAPGASLMRNGENGRGMASRWYPETLKNRLLDIHMLHSRIQFQSGDGIKFITDNAAKEEIVWFIDPPYTIAGRRLYLHSVINHEKLFEETAKLRGRFLMTYDDTEQIRSLAKEHNFEIAKIPMKNTHHVIMNELLIAEDLEWVRN